MNLADDRGGPRDLARGLVDALAPVLCDVASRDAVGVACEAAQILGLPGLDRLLAACAPHAGHPWPAELVPALERLRRLAASAVETGALGIFREADRELAGLADEVAALQWSPALRAGSDDAQPVATLNLADALDDLPLADDSSRELARRSQLLPPVAAALRAALDWLTSDSGRPLVLRAEDSVLEASCEHVDFDALTPATEVLAAVGANLGPGLGPVGTWTVRVPLHTGRGAYLMLVHGGVPIAIPWHAVLRLHMAGAAELADRESLSGWPVLNGPLGGGSRPAGDVPLALVAHGRKRGWLVADRLVWRLHAEPVAPTERSPADGLGTMVETEEGERYWLADPGWLLRSLEAPVFVRSAPEPAPGAEPRVLRGEIPVSRPVAPAPVVPVRPAPHLWLLRPEDVERIEAEDVEPVDSSVRTPAPALPFPDPPRISDPAPATPNRAAPALTATASAPPVRRPMLNALVAEDSITARIFLARLLTRLGFDVSTVDTAAALRAELERCSWSLVCVDLELPDEAGTAFLAGLAARHGARTPFVVLVRDADDRAAARRAGFERMLRKPFDHQELEQILGRLGLLPPEDVMSVSQTTARGPVESPCILIVDDDRRILELLEIAFAAHGFRVLTAPDGDAAIKCVLTERPDLLVLDVRLPKKSGLEVCEWLRRDPDDPSVPVIMVSAVADVETRLQAFTRGADDYLTKPFSPKELIARVKRLLARSAEARAARARQHELERELTQTREAARRSHTATQREQRLRDFERGPGLDLLSAGDEDELARRLLPLLRARLGVAMVGLLLPGNDGGALVPAAVRGDGPERLAPLALSRTGALAVLLAGLERPVVRRDLERFPELALEVAPFVAEGVALLVPLRGPDGLEGLVVLDERRDGLPFPLSELEALASIARFAGVALHHARRVRALAERALVEFAGRGTPGDGGRRARAEAGFLVEHAAQATLVPLRQRRLLAFGIRLGRGAATGEEAEALERLAADDPTGLVRDLVTLFARADVPAGAGDDTPATGDGRAAVLLAVALLHAEERERGVDPRSALSRALAVAGARLDPITRQALEAAARELALLTVEAA